MLAQTVVERPVCLDDMEAALGPNVGELETAVMGYVTQLSDPKSELYKDFYGPDGLEARELQVVDRPSGGHTLLVQNETGHAVTVGDNLHTVGAFKRRGAWLAALEADRYNRDLERFVAASAGNHALGVAAAAAALDKQADIYCKSDISLAKEEKLLALGAVLHKNTSGPDDTLEHALQRAQEAARPGEDGRQTAHLIHPFDQVEVIAGQATVGMEMLHSLLQRANNGELDLRNDPVEVLVQVGGGGLLSGVAIVFKAARDMGIIGDNVKVVGVQMENCDAGIRSVERLAKGEKPVDLFEEDELNTWSDGTAVTQVGELPLLVLQDERYVQEFQRVSELGVAGAMHELTGTLNTTIEPAGALSYAAAKKRAAEAPVRDGLGNTIRPKTTLVSIVSGANTSKETYDRSRELRDADYRARMAALASLVTAGELDFGYEPPSRTPRLFSTQTWCSPVTRRMVDMS